MFEVPIVPRNPDLLAPVVTRWNQFRTAAQFTADTAGHRSIWNVNATATGGGVAEMLPVLLGYLKGIGVNARWLVLDGDAPFFAITKRIHNLLHGVAQDGELGDAERAVFEAATERNMIGVTSEIKPRELVILHDPQTAGLIPRLKERGAYVMWRCHIGLDEANEHTEKGWAFLAPYLDAADRLVVSRETYAPPGQPHEKLIIIRPSIDPFAPKNRDMSAQEVTAVLNRVGFFAGRSGPDTATFLRDDGTPAALRHHENLFAAGGPVPPDARIVLQVSRWDRLKDMPGVMKGFAEHTDLPDDVHLVLCGPSVEGVTDDPEGEEVLQECIDFRASLPPEMQERIHLACFPMDDRDENAVMINALQRHASVVVQKSLAEGFGLTVTEAMWKGRAVIASAVGGINDQITHEHDGLLVSDPTDLAEFGALLGRVLREPLLASLLGDNAREHARREFLPDRHLMQYAIGTTSTMGPENGD